MFLDPYQGELFIYICIAKGNRQSSKWAAHKELHGWFGGGCGKTSPCSCYYLLDRTPGILIFFISRDSLSFCQKHKNNNDGFSLLFCLCGLFYNERHQGIFLLFQWQSPDWKQDRFCHLWSFWRDNNLEDGPAPKPTTDFHCPGQNIPACSEI